jgi:hypothetical protein
MRQGLREIKDIGGAECPHVWHLRHAEAPAQHRPLNPDFAAIVRQHLQVKREM